MKATVELTAEELRIITNLVGEYYDGALRRGLLEILREVERAVLQQGEE